MSRRVVHAELRRPSPRARPAAPGSPSSQFNSDFAPNFSPTHIVGTGLRETYKSFAHNLTENIAPLGLSINMWFVLRTLWQEDGLTQNALATRIDVSPAAMVKLINNLREMGLLTRESGADRRAAYVRLTAKGRGLRLKATAQALQTEARALRGFSVEEVRMLLAMLERLRVNLAEPDPSEEG